MQQWHGVLLVSGGPPRNHDAMGAARDVCAFDAREVLEPTNEQPQLSLSSLFFPALQLDHSLAELTRSRQTTRLRAPSALPAAGVVPPVVVCVNLVPAIETDRDTTTPAHDIHSELRAKLGIRPPPNALDLTPSDFTPPLLAWCSTARESRTKLYICHTGAASASASSCPEVARALMLKRRKSRIRFPPPT